MLLLYALAHPLPSPFSAPDALNSSVSADNQALISLDNCGDIRSCRTIEEIVYSCVAVIFACTWVAIHPNVPRLFTFARGSGWKEICDPFSIHWAVVGLQDVLFMLLILIFPELIILWAMRQWFGASKLAEKYKDHGWTTTHGFFVVMGGFLFHKNGKFSHTLEMDDWLNPDIAQAVAVNLGGELTFENCHNNYVFNRHSEQKFGSAETMLDFLVQTNLISVTEDEIMDKSKRDTISKAVVIGQTLWFIIQCGARAVEGLPVTNLEIMTLAFAALSFATYFMWWNKPQRLRYPIRIDISESKLQEGNLRKESNCPVPGTKNQGSVSQDLEPASSDKRMDMEKENLVPKNNSTSTTCSKWASLKSFLNSIWCRIKEAFKALGGTFSLDWKTVSEGFDFIPLPIRIVTYPILTIINQSAAMLYGDAHYETGIKLNDTPKRLWATFFLLFVLFGGIHFIPWSFAFPTHTEQILWRVCALAVTTFPFVFLLTWVSWREPLSGIIEDAMQILTVIILPLLYIFARFTLVVLAFMELRALSPDTYKTVEWTTLIPHI